MKIRKATKEDITTLLDIEKKSNFPLPQYNFTRRYFNRALKTKKIFILGNIAFCIVRDYKDGCEIDAIVVVKEHQRKGIGTILLNKMIEETKAAGKKKIYSFCWDKNNPALNFYKKHSFYKTEERKNRYNGNETALLLCKDLHEKK